MKTPSNSNSRRPLGACPAAAATTPARGALRAPVLALVLVLAAAAFAPAAADAFVTPAQAEAAAERGAAWFETGQEESGALASDWGMTALAAAGTNAADVRTDLIDPSAQDYYLGEWETEGPGGAGTDAERGILAGVAGGIQTSRLGTSSDTTRSNLVARVAELWDGTQIGEEGLLNDDIFGVLALRQAGAPQPLLQRIVDYLRTKQLPDGGWSWNASPSATADTDMTGSVVAAFCAAGVPADDPDLQQALTLLHSLQDPETGGFIAPPPFGVGVNTDTTAWVTSGLIQCGIDPQSLEWTTADGKTPLDYLVSMQAEDGHFDWTAEYGGGAFETYDSVRPLAGVAFSTAAPDRADPALPAVHPAAAVATGTTVPITLVIDHGPANEDVRMCRVDVASGSDLAAVLAAAKASSTPGDCVSEEATEASAGGVRVASLDGVPAGEGYAWKVRVDGGEATTEASEPIGFGDLVFLQFGAEVAEPGPAPRVSVPPVVPAQPQPASPGARVKVIGRASWAAGELRVALACPRGLGELGCRGLLSARFHADGGWKAGGSAAYELGSGTRRMLSIPATGALRARLASGDRVHLRLTAATRGETGAVRVTQVRRTLAG